MRLAAPARRRPRPGPWSGWPRLLALIALLFATAAAAPPTTAPQATAPQATARHALLLEIDGAIGPATAGYVTRALADADPQVTGLVILRMDTPGGLDTAMRSIIRAMLASPVPVVVYVAPSGARAASAGTYITYASAVAAMAPGTNLGAATPIQITGPDLLPGAPDKAPDKAPEKAPDKGSPEAGKGGEAKPAAEPPASGDTETRKIVNDAVAYIRSLAELHGRNADWAESAVRGAASLSAIQALERHVIDLIAVNLTDLLGQLDGREAMAGGRHVRLATAALAVREAPPDWRTRALSVITNPNVAYLLMLLGAYGLIFELANPGAVLPGLVGAICGLLALFALNLLPVDYAGAGLVLLGIALMIAEAFIGSFGVIGVGGIVAFAIGSLIMFDTSLPAFGLSPWVVGAATAVSAAFFILVLSMLARSRRRKVATGKEALIGATVEVVAWERDHGRVRLSGELWQARGPGPFAAGARVKVTGRDGLVLTVEPAAGPSDAWAQAAGREP